MINKYKGEVEEDMDMDFVQVAKIKVIGVGGGGCNAVARMVAEDVQGVDFYVANTDAQILKGINVPNKIVLGKSKCSYVEINGTYGNGTEIKYVFALDTPVTINNPD